MNEQRQNELICELVRLGLWDESDPRDPTQDEAAALLVFRRLAQRTRGQHWALSPWGSPPDDSYDAMEWEVSYGKWYSMASEPDDLEGTFCDVICRAAIAGILDLKNYYEGNGSPVPDDPKEWTFRYE